MKKILLFIYGLLLVGLNVLYAQTPTITGKVTAAEDGSPIPGVSVVVKGTSRGTVTNENGDYTIQASSNQTLVYSFIGSITQEIEVGSKSIINVALETDGRQLEEFVVTGLGISKSERSIGYSVQKIDGDKLQLAQETNVLNSLAGKVSGVQVIGGASSSIGGSAKVRIRGVNGLTGGDPLYVVDGTPLANNNFSSTTDGPDYGNLASDINPDDIETLNVLKGPAATAIYGERGKYGVVLITTKKGTKKKGLGVTLKSSVSTERVYILPEYQNEYAGGYSQALIDVVDPVDGQTYKRLNYSADESWGPKMDGTVYRPWYSWYPGTADYGKTVPLSPQPDNVKSFFENGVTNTNGVDVSGASDLGSIRLGFTNQNQQGVIPNSKYGKNTIAAVSTLNITKNLMASVNVTFVDQKGSGRTSFGYSALMGNPVNSFNQWFQRQLTMEELKNYKGSDGSMRSWNIRSPFDPAPLYWDSPYFSVYENVPTDQRTRYFGNIGLTYKVNDAITIRGTFYRDNYVQGIQERVATGGLELDYFRDVKRSGSEDNYELLGIYSKNFGKISLDGTLGGNIRKNGFRTTAGNTNGGLTSVNFFNLGASKDRPTLTSTVYDKEVRSLFASANIGYDNTYYLGATLRNDWSSALPVDNNSYLYSSLTGSVVFSNWINSRILSFGKLRGSIAQVGSDLDSYQVAMVYGLGTPHGSSANYQVPNQFPNQNLKPAITTSWEFGTDVMFLNNRFGFDFTYYHNNNKDEIIPIDISGASGFATALINAGFIQSKGFELGFNAKPVVNQNFTWESRINFGRNRTIVKELYGGEDGLQNYLLATGIGGANWGGLTLNAFVGEYWGLLRGQGYTYLDGHEGDPNYRIIDEEGNYEITANKNLGSILPDFTGGWQNSFRYKGFDLGINIDFQKGGRFHSITRMFNNYSGLGFETVGNNDKGNPIRSAIADGGGMKVTGVLADGTPHTTYVDPQSAYSGYFGLHERHIYDASYVKIRDVALGYSLPSKTISKTPFQSLRVAFIAKNPWLIHSNVVGFDPSEILPGANNLAFEERSQLPSVRSFGVSLVLGL
jgi:TonB-linked SusC/RagA family outer membrane protein